MKFNKRGVFGLTSVQQFFAIILGIALLAYVIVVIVGTLNADKSILPLTSGTVTNETGYINRTGYYLQKYTVPGFSGASVTAINATNGLAITSGNYSVGADGLILNATNGARDCNWSSVNFTYTYKYDGSDRIFASGILSNTSDGVTGFFENINPVYAILAILVIILILVVLVRVVTGGTEGTGMRRAEPSL